MADIYGSDLSTFSGSGNSIGLDPLGTPITGPRVVLEAVARRLMTPRGSLPGFPQYGFDLMGLLGKRLTPVAKKRIEADIVAECEADERVLKATIVEFVETSKDQYRLRIALQLTEGPFALVLSVSQVTVELLQAA